MNSASRSELYGSIPKNQCNIWKARYEPRHEIFINVVCATSKASDQTAHAYAQSGQTFFLPLKYTLSVTLLTEHNLEFLNLKGGCTGSSESTHVKIPHCWKSRVEAQLC